MSISEEQFARMLKGTVHEGRYGVPVKPAVVETPIEEEEYNYVPCEYVPKGKRVSATDSLAGDIKRAIPICVGIRLLTSSDTYILLGVIVLCVGAVIQSLYDVFVAPFL